MWRTVETSVSKRVIFNVEERTWFFLLHVFIHHLVSVNMNVPSVPCITSDNKIMVDTYRKGKGYVWI